MKYSLKSSFSRWVLGLFFAVLEKLGRDWDADSQLTFGQPTWLPVAGVFGID